MESKPKEVSELRQDPVSRDWVIVSTGRAKRPEVYKSSLKPVAETSVSTCPFEDPAKFGNEIVKTFKNKDNSDWAIQVIKNKFPIVSGNQCATEKQSGPYTIKTEASGQHEVVIVRDHSRSLAELSHEEIIKVVEVYQDRYHELKDKECVDYILIIHNHGREAGASISHPHSQILAIPFVPSDIKRSLYGARNYHNETNRCVHCDILAWELNQKTRIIFENDTMVAKAPYVPKFSFQIRIIPKKHQSFFEDISPEEVRDLAEALQVSLSKLYHGLNNPAYNFFIHTAPSAGAENYKYYHWHLEIMPRLGYWGGFELGTGGDIIDTDPDEAARYLRDIKV